MSHDPLCRTKHMSVTTDISDIDGCDCALIAKVRADERADLRARVEALRTNDRRLVAYDEAVADVLALLDEAP